MVEVATVHALNFSLQFPSDLPLTFGPVQILGFLFSWSSIVAGTSGLKTGLSAHSMIANPYDYAGIDPDEIVIAAMLALELNEE